MRTSSNPRTTVSSPAKLLTARSALILTLAVLVGVAAAVLSVLAGRNLADGAIAAGVAFGGAIPLFNTIIGD